MKRTRLICVGACCIDTILSVPHFPEEDSKLRATSLRKSRGGNTPNTLEVLQQLIDHNQAQPYLELFLIATLPALGCAESRFIACSLDPVYAADTTRSPHELMSVEECARVNSSDRHKVNIAHCIYREDHTEAVSAYIINSESTSSRTIVNHNALPEMTFDEFVKMADQLLTPMYLWCTSTGLVNGEQQEVDVIWFHFEGRIPETTLACINYLRMHEIFEKRLDLRISVELEKPGREGLQDLAREADVVFYSKAWARGAGYESPEELLNKQVEVLIDPSPPHALYNYRTLICTWGDQGSTAAVVAPEGRKPRVSVRSVKAYIPSDHYGPRPQIVDSTGAGDTFIAGMLYGMTGRHFERNLWAVELAMSFANHLAGHKILQYGFQGLGSLRCILNRKAELEWPSR